MENFQTKRSRQPQSSESQAEAASESLPVKDQPSSQSSSSPPQSRRARGHLKPAPFLTRHSFLPKSTKVAMKKSKLAVSEEGLPERSRIPEFFSQNLARSRSQCPASLQSLLRAVDQEDDMQVLQSLSTLSMDLATSSDEVLSTFPVDQLFQALLVCMQKDHVPDIVLFAINCLTSILDIAPSLAASLVQMQAIGVLTTKLMNFEFVDLAESTIKALEKISVENAQSILKEGSFGTMMQMMEFFEVQIQKSIMTIGVNIAKTLNNKEIFQNHLAPILSKFSQFIEYRGNDFFHQTEGALTFYCFLIESLFRVYCEQETILKEHLDSLTWLVEAIMDLTEKVQNLACKILKLLKIICKYSAGAVASFFSMNWYKFLQWTLSQLDRPVFIQGLGMIEAILPPSFQQTEFQIQKQGIFESIPENLRQICQLVVPKVISTYENFTNRSVKLLVISLLEKLISISPVELMVQFSQGSFPPFVAELLVSQDYKIVSQTLEIIQKLYQKIPYQIANSFYREGVVARIQQLKKPESIRHLKQSERINLSGTSVRRLLSSTREMESHMIEELMNNLTKSKGEQGRRKNEQAKHKVLDLCKGILQTQRIHQNRDAFKIGNQLKMISKNLQTEGVARLVAFMKQQSISSFQFCDSKLASSILEWLKNAADTRQARHRLQQFFTSFLQYSAKGQLLMSSLINLLLNGTIFVKNFRINPNELSFTRNMQRVRITFIYTSQGQNALDFYDLTPQYEFRHSLFSETKKFNLTVQNTTSFDIIKHQILKIRNKEDLKNWKQMFKSDKRKIAKDQHLQQLRNMGLSQQEAKYELALKFPTTDPQQESELVFPVRRKSSEFVPNLDIEFLVNGSLIRRGMLVCDVTRNPSLTLQFRLGKTKDQNQIQQILSTPDQIYQYYLFKEISSGFDLSDKSMPFLKLLNFIYTANSLQPNLLSPVSLVLPQSSLYTMAKIPPTHFRSIKLTATLKRKIQQGILPYQSWTRTFPVSFSFLFPFSVRADFWYLVNGFKHTVNRNRPRHKVRVDRENIKENAFSIFSDTKLLKQGPLDIEYQGEVGTGLGPTLEFYSLVAKELREPPLWREFQQYGLFPAPVGDAGFKVWDQFVVIGRLVAKALIDKKQVDLPFNPVWWKLVLNQPLTLIDLQGVDPNLGRTLLELKSLLNKSQKSEEFLYKESRIQDLHLTFVLPGYPHISLINNGDNLLVTQENLFQYIDLVVEETLLQKIQAEAFRKGINTLFPVDSLQVFKPEQLEYLVCGDNKVSWKIEDLILNISPQHGYSQSSKTFLNLLKVMSEFDQTSKRQFLQFVTGSPRLPLGGFSRLTPKLTVVKTNPTAFGDNPDGYLPSVMTCQNYLKLPDYSSYEVLEKQLRYAIAGECQGFYLSQSNNMAKLLYLIYSLVSLLILLILYVYYLVCWLIKGLVYYFVIKGFYRTEKMYLQAQRLRKKPYHIVFCFNRMPDSFQVQQFQKWSSYIGISQVSFYSPYIHVQDGQMTGFLNEGVTSLLERVSQHVENRGVFRKNEFCLGAADLVLVVGRSNQLKGMPLNHIASAEIYYIGNRANVMDFFRALYRFHLSEQRNGK